ncbi:gag/pol protein [Cucumis melo var. makuwa]|uniref:Gag/pol protein n=1 Tax=Cucumis melo var. makuwa TaxID=1194695 RepID=A0A5D3CA97_CUCMM|nr:gag/pol protein [Cucumis melo var. makuwa]TYK08465.1 gag/pol protein [Cucumis melo var. makuwa]
MDSLKGMFRQPKWSLSHETIKYIYTERMKEETSVRELVLDMMMHFNITEVNYGAIDEANQVSFILESLPKSFIPFQTNASLNKIELHLTILLNELQRFQNLTKSKGKEVEANVATTKRKFKRGLSSKSKAGPSKPNRKIEKKGKGKTPKQNKEKKTIEKVKCNHCGENGHWLRNCPKYLAQKKSSERSTRKIVLGKGFLRARSLSKLVLEKWSQLKQWEILSLSETQNVIPDDGIDDPLTYKQAMNDVDCDQWIKAMNLKMESMYSNFVWTLVDQPNDVKPIGCKWIYKRKRDQAGKVQTFKAD